MFIPRVPRVPGDETDAQRAARLDVARPKTTKRGRPPGRTQRLKGSETDGGGAGHTKPLKGNEADVGGFGIVDRVIYQMADNIDAWSNALVRVARGQGLRLEYQHCRDLLGWAVERSPLLLATLYRSRPSQILCENILENSPPLSRYAPSLADIAEHFAPPAPDVEDMHAARKAAKRLVSQLGPDEVRRRWYLETLPRNAPRAEKIETDWLPDGNIPA